MTVADSFAIPSILRLWRKAQVLLMGGILEPTRRMVSAALYVLGLQGRGDSARYSHASVGRPSRPWA